MLPPPPPRKRLKTVVSKPLKQDVTEVPTEEEDEELEIESSPGIRIPDVSGLQKRVRKLLKFTAYEPEQKYWLDTGYPELNAALGSETMGLPYGKIFELAGQKHGGKTAITTIIGGMAQQDGAAVGYVDLERSSDKIWAGKLGMNLDASVLIYPKMILAKKKKKKGSKKPDDDSDTGGMARLQSAELIFAEMQEAMADLHEQGFKKQFWMVDSIAVIQTALALEAGTVDRNMRVNVDRAQFLSALLPTLASLAANYNAMVFFINQIRTKPGVAFGNPEYSPGGNAVPFVASVQAKIRRIGNGKLTKNGQVIGIAGKIVNEKNKTGEGSEESKTTAFKIWWNRSPVKIRFMSVAEAEEQ